MAQMLVSGCKPTQEGLPLGQDDNGLPFQIFPDPCESCEGQGKLKDRLPSIVVEPTDVSEVESGELRWPPDDFPVAEPEADGGPASSGDRGQSPSETEGEQHEQASGTTGPGAASPHPD
ncbi:protein LBH-like [Mobula hypostoma]|uniref:protein LBH-like n=1 Tax=Mobula hypostoma TaxID=723540 RepID=UPI002FC2DBA3